MFFVGQISRYPLVNKQFAMDSMAHLVRWFTYIHIQLLYIYINAIPMLVDSTCFKSPTSPHRW